MAKRLATVLQLALVVVGPPACSDRQPAPPTREAVRWIWDSLVVGVDTLRPGAVVVVGPAAGLHRPVRLDGRSLGLAPDSSLHHYPLLDTADVWAWAVAQVQREFTRPHRVIFDSQAATVRHLGAGVFAVSGTVEIPDPDAPVEAVEWTIWLRRLRYRWHTDSMQIGAARIR